MILALAALYLVLVWSWSFISVLVPVLQPWFLQFHGSTVLVPNARYQGTGYLGVICICLILVLVRFHFGSIPAIYRPSIQVELKVIPTIQNQHWLKKYFELFELWSEYPFVVILLFSCKKNWKSILEKKIIWVLFTAEQLGFCYQARLIFVWMDFPVFCSLVLL